MSFKEIQKRLVGLWSGESLLRTPWLEPAEHLSQSAMTISPVAHGYFLSFAYTWKHEETSHEGLLIVGNDDNAGLATASWIDSWHMNSKVWSCKGTATDAGVVDLFGSYEAPPGPDWGWRIVIQNTSAEVLEMVMYNVTPEGEEDIAVRANYTRL